MTDENLKHPITEGGGIKGAFWANLIGADYVSQLDMSFQEIAELELEEAITVEGGGLVLFVSESPVGHVSDFQLYSRYANLREVLRPIFISENQHPQFASCLGQWSRENAAELVVGP